MDETQPPLFPTHLTRMDHCRAAAKYAGTIPLLIIVLLCDYLKEVLDSSESFLEFSYPYYDWKHTHYAYRGLLDVQTRQLLSALSLVHPSWTEHARSAVKTRLCIDEMRGDSDKECFEQSTLVGPWVQEVQIYDNISHWDYERYGYTYSPYNSESDDESEPEDPGLRIEIVKRFPNLRALILSMGAVKETLHRLIGIESLGRSLRSLHVQLDYCEPETLVQLRILVTQLPNITTLSILGFDYSDHPVEDDTAEQLRAVQHVPPPSSLKRLMIEWQFDVQYHKTFNPYIRWFLDARDGFALEELRLYVFHRPRTFRHSITHDTVDHILPALENTLPYLKVFDVRTWLKTDRSCISFTPNLFRTLGQRCPQLEELHMDIFRMKSPKDKLVLPRSLKKLHVFTTQLYDMIDISPIESLDEILATGGLPDLREIGCSSFYSDAAIERDPLLLRKICQKHGISFSTFRDAEINCTWNRNGLDPATRWNH